MPEVAKGFIFDKRNPLMKLHVNGWVERHKLSVALAGIVIQLAAIAEPLHFIAHSLRNGTAGKLFPPRPPSKVWRRLYRSHKEILGALGDASPTQYGDGKSILSLLDFIRAAKRWAKESPDELNAWSSSVEPRMWLIFLKRAFREAKKFHIYNLREYRDLIREESDKGSKIEQLLREKPEIYFFLLVILPCMCEYETLPLSLIRKARRGEEKAIEQLVRLDDSMVAEPFIQRWRDAGTGQERREKVEWLAGWMREGIGGQLTLSSVKQSMAGLIALMVSLNPVAFSPRGRHIVKISSSDIRDLFNAVARDRGTSFGAGRVDEDLYHISDESWRQAVSKRKQAWHASVPKYVSKTFV